MVKRWDLVSECPSCVMQVNGSGVFTQHSDYAALEKERDEYQSAYQTSLEIISVGAQTTKALMQANDELRKLYNDALGGIQDATDLYKKMKGERDELRAKLEIMERALQDVVRIGCDNDAKHATHAIAAIGNKP